MIGSPLRCFFFSRKVCIQQFLKHTKIMSDTWDGWDSHPQKWGFGLSQPPKLLWQGVISLSWTSATWIVWWNNGVLLVWNHRIGVSERQWLMDQLLKSDKICPERVGSIWGRPLCPGSQWEHNNVIFFSKGRLDSKKPTSIFTVFCFCVWTPKGS